MYIHTLCSRSQHEEIDLVDQLPDDSPDVLQVIIVVVCM